MSTFDEPAPGRADPTRSRYCRALPSMACHPNDAGLLEGRAMAFTRECSATVGRAPTRKGLSPWRLGSQTLASKVVAQSLELGVP
jgi:hypothetical protein